tara:strand:- start:571 stop:1878 length:1308 start_codon:yes stop_codon:yes gene_type:complete
MRGGKVLVFRFTPDGIEDVVENYLKNFDLSSVSELPAHISDMSEMTPLMDFSVYTNCLVNKFLCDKDYDYIAGKCLRAMEYSVYNKEIFRGIAFDAAIVARRADGIIRFSYDALRIRNIFSLYENDFLLDTLSTFDLEARDVINAFQAWKSRSSGLGVYAANNPDRYLEYLQVILDDFKEINGVNVAYDAIQRFGHIKDIDAAADAILEASNYLCPINNILSLHGRNSYHHDRWYYQHVFKNFTIGEAVSYSFKVYTGREATYHFANRFNVEKSGEHLDIYNRPYYRYTSDELAFQTYRSWMLKYMREAENKLLSDDHMPEFGKGWINELRLLNLVEYTFRDIKVIHQGRPKWLKRQSLDIYLPGYNIAIEYQGEQHTRPIEFFGGETQFAQQQRRDAAKRKLCKENGCLLIEIFPDYVDSDVLDQIRTAIISRG